MTKRNAKRNALIKQTLSEIILFAVMIAIIIGFIWWLRYHYNNVPSTHTETVYVERCVQGNRYYVVTIADKNGNLWDYYCDVPQNKGDIVRVTWRNNEIIDAE